MQFKFKQWIWIKNFKNIWSIYKEQGDLNLQNGSDQRTVFDTFIENILPVKSIDEKIFFEKLKLMLSHQANPNLINKLQSSPFMYLC